MSTFKLLIRFAKPYPGWMLLTFLLGFSGALFNGVGTTLIVPVVLKIIGLDIELNNAPDILKIVMRPFDRVPEDYRTLVMAIAIILTIILKNLASYASTLTSSSLARTLTTDMREAGLKNLLEVDLDYFVKTKVGDAINSLSAELGKAASSVNTVIRVSILVITIFVFIAVLVSISWQLTIAATFLLSLVTLVNQYAIARSKDYGKLLSDMSRAYSITVLEVMNGMRLVRATANEDREYTKIVKLIRNREQADFKSQANSEAITPVSEVMGITALVMIILLSKYLFASQISSLSTVLFTYLLVLLRLLPFISQLNAIRSSFANASTSVSIANDFLRRDNKPFMSRGAKSYKALEKGIHFNNISFAYPGSDKLVLKEVDLFLPKGTTLALVGSSGAGKSTMADLLPRFYDVISGSILLDGVDLKEFDIQSLRRAMGIVSQDTFLFNDTVRYNIAYGKPDATEEEIIAATQRANAYEFVTKLSQGFDTLIGDRGVMLSGGQRQRLAIARALLQNPEILILDEATSALDTVSERVVQAAIDDLSKDRTTLVIAHRLSTVQAADQIAVLDQGKVVEVGTHNSLLQKGGYYTRLYTMQFGAEDSEKQFTEAKLTNGQNTEVLTHNQNLVRIPHELRTRLNPTIGFLQLLIDEASDSEEREELIEEIRKSTARVENIIEIFEDIVKLQTSFITSVNDTYKVYRDNLDRLVKKLRTHLNFMLHSLPLIVDGQVQTSEQNEIIKNISYAAIHLLDTIQELEDFLKSKSLNSSGSSNGLEYQQNGNSKIKIGL
ncbi:MAG: ABC transporter ATP-binding protein/permease [Calothrix sp. FI2-JRJ7]|jgi:subfamily B ATP-binding cassette protein MsbA|nr:ABC transporter ATP-binding protein/permease [Calothrix sp. FI2-JRJ7]